MKKIILLGLIFVSLLAVGCKKEDNVNKLSEIKNKEEIIVGTSADYPPFEFKKMIDGNDEIVGFEIELAKHISEKLGVKCTVVDMDFTNIPMALKTNKIDIALAAMNPTEKRKKEIDFSDIYYQSGSSILINKKDSDSIKSLEDLNGKKIGAQMGSVQEEFAQGVEGINLETLPLVTTLIMNLNTEKVDGIILEEPVAREFEKKFPELTIVKEIEIKNDDQGFAVGINKGNEDLLNEINNIIKTVLEENLVDKWMIDAINLLEENN